MNKHSRLSVVSSSVLVGVIFAVGFAPTLRAQKFEGTIEFTATTQRGTMPMVYSTNGDHVRFETEGRPGMKAIILIDVKENKTVMLMDQMKAYMDVNVPPSQSTDKPKPDIKKTGKTKKILGYECE